MGATPVYGITYPEDTDPVSEGAAAIRDTAETVEAALTQAVPDVEAARDQAVAAVNAAAAPTQQAVALLYLTMGA